MRAVTRTEGILPALETAHAVAALPKLLAGVEGSGAALPDDAIVPARLLGPRRQGPGRARAVRGRRAVGVGAMTIDELRAFCMSLPGTHEKETWGDAEHAGDVTFRVKDKIYLITGPDGGAASDPHVDRAAGRPHRRVPDSTKVAAYVGRFGWVHVELEGPDALDDEVVREAVRSAWRRTIPKSMLRELEAGGGVSAIASRPSSASSAASSVPHTNDTAGARRAAEGFARARAGGRSALIPYVVAGIRMPRRELRDRLRRDRRRRGPARGRAPVLGPARGRRHAPAGVAGRARGRRDVRPVARARRADCRRPAGRADRADGLREPADRRR